MRSRGVLTGAAHFAGQLIRNPIKTTLNTIEGIKAGPDFPDNKIVTGLAGAGGLAAAFIGAINRDPLLTGIGLTFASVAGGIYEPTGARIRAEAHTERLAEEAGKAATGPVVKETAAPEKTNDNGAAAEAVTTPEAAAADIAGTTGPIPKPLFKPNLPRPKGLDGGP